EEAEDHLKEFDKEKKRVKKMHNTYINRLNNQKISDVLKECKQDLEVTCRAKEIVELAERRIPQKVLPKTIENLTKILPILTADRYKDVEITENYDVRVFDSRLKNYVEKQLFSGGTNDQIALGIRLAFALATMTKTDYNESFIFLDEPLGFFDDERKNSLIDFLTRGEIAEIFSQRFVISNFSNIQPYFDYIIELDDGEIIKQYSTGSLITIQGKVTEENTPKLSCFYVCPDVEIDADDDGSCEVECRIMKLTEYQLTRADLKIANRGNIIIKPKSLFFKGSGSNEKSIIFNFNKRDLEEDKIQFIAFMYHDNEKIGHQELEINIKEFEGN
ncbi:MAG: ATP-binding protein, partial [Promethearchaeota archaeon]